MARKHRFESAALRYLYASYVGNGTKRRAEYEESVASAQVAMQLYALRTKAGLTQMQLAKKVGTSRSVISRLEDADYEGHSLALLRRIADALNRNVEVHFVPRRGSSKPVARKTAGKRRVA